ncbi:oxidoreductase [Exophiala viscosa]|uniref:oxidoreductase n=1 Tax=Exophiala viscosa TaxID=2486360 RepID=UPI0021987B2C|nr:oxidoreductase [Exophiala viscosa]
MDPMKVGIIGYGFSVKCFHLPFIQSLSEYKVVAFFQRAEAPKDPKSAESGSHCTVDHPEAKHYRTADEFFADKDVEVVIVCSKQDTHAEYAEKALLTGKHAVVEKAFTRTTEEADHLIKLAKEKGLILTVFQNRRWDSDFLTLSHLTKHDALGEINEAEIHYDVDFPFWMRGMTAKKYTPGDGLMFGLGSHTIDQALLLFGPPKSITCFLRVLRGVDSEIEDSFTLILQYDSPLLVTVKTNIASCMRDGDQPKYFVRGSKGSYVKHTTCIQEQQVFDGMKPTDPKFGVEDASLNGLLTTNESFDKTQTHDSKSKKYVGRYPTIPGRWLGFYENLAQAIRGKADVAVKPEQSRDGIKIMELARLSHEKGQTIPWG